MNSEDVRLTPIKNGTALDHLPKGSALKILEILGLEAHDKAVTIAINTESRKLGKKDLVFIEGKALSTEEIEKIGLIAEGATLNYIENSIVKSKAGIELPEKAIGILKCLNPKCVTNYDEIPTKFSISRQPFKAKCHYCEKIIAGKEISEAVR